MPKKPLNSDWQMEYIMINLGDDIKLKYDCTSLHPELLEGKQGRVVGDLDDEDRYLVDFWFTRKRIHISSIGEVIPKIKETESDFIKDDVYAETLECTFDTVNKPKHYNSSKFETIEVIKEWGGKEKYRGFCWGNVIKYCSRYEHKNGLEDLKKAQYYLNKLIASVEDENA